MDISTITYDLNRKISPKDFIQILIDSSLGERRPIDDYERMTQMVERADILITAWDHNKLVGVARSISDYTYCTYLADLAVHVDYQKRGIGKELIRKTRDVAGHNGILLVIAAPAAKEYYSHIGFEKLVRGWILFPLNQIY